MAKSKKLELTWIGKDDQPLGVNLLIPARRD